MAWNMKKFLLVLHTLLICIILTHGSSSENDFEEAKTAGKLIVHWLDPVRAKYINRTAADASKVDVDIFCFKGLPTKSLLKIWSSATVKLNIGEDYVLYMGHNESHVYDQFLESARSWGIQLMPWRTNQISLPVFNKTCLGVDTKQTYSVDFIIKGVDVWLVGFTVTGILLFLSAKRLSKNVMFYYATGMSLGVLASVLVLVFILSRFMPGKSGAIAILVGGWSMTLYLLQYVWENIQTLLESYYWYFIGYFCTAGVLSFAYCYYKGPVSNPRSMDLIKWSIQGIGLVLVYQGCQIHEVALAFIILILTMYNFPSTLYRKASAMWRRRFPPKRRFLTENEYIEEGNEETKKALEELRSFCRSPDCDAWKTMSRLSSPNKFAGFMEGNSHLSEDEIVDYENNSHRFPKYDTDEESEISFSLNSQ